MRHRMWRTAKGACSPRKLSDLRRKLNRKAKQEPGYRRWSQPRFRVPTGRDLPALPLTLPVQNIPASREDAAEKEITA